MNGHNTNIVAVGLIYDDQGRIFIARRSDNKTFQPGQFELLGGHLEPDESLEDGLKREIMEELHIDVAVRDIVGAFTYRDEEAMKVEVAYLCEIMPDATIRLNPEDHSEGSWISAGDVSNIGKEDEETDLIRKAFKILEGGNNE